MVWECPQFLPYRFYIFFLERIQSPQISITPNVHAVIKHIPEFFDNQAEKHDTTQHKLTPTVRNKFLRALVCRSEQASKSVHEGFIRRCETGAYKQNLAHPE